LSFAAALPAAGAPQLEVLKSKSFAAANAGGRI
jgi:hypothetical protein